MRRSRSSSSFSLDDASPRFPAKRLLPRQIQRRGVKIKRKRVFVSTFFSFVIVHCTVKPRYKEPIFKKKPLYNEVISSLKIFRNNESLDLKQKQKFSVPSESLKRGLTVFLFQVLFKVLFFSFLPRLDSFLPQILFSSSSPVISIIRNFTVYNLRYVVPS
jgi:hypothetical protein